MIAKVDVHLCSYFEQAVCYKNPSFRVLDSLEVKSVSSRQDHVQFCYIGEIKPEAAPIWVSGSRACC